MEIQKAQVTIKPLGIFQKQFSEKYRKGLKLVAAINVRDTIKAHPEWGLVEVLVDILKTTNRDMPPAFLAEFVQHIIASWERYEAAKKETSELAVA